MDESSDNVNIVHVQSTQSTPAPNSSLPSCLLSTSSALMKDTPGLKGMIVNCDGLKSPSRFSEFQRFLLIFISLISFLAVNPSSTAKCPYTRSFHLPILCSERTVIIVMEEVCSWRLSPRLFVRKSLPLEKIAKSFGQQLTEIGHCKTLHLAVCYRPPNSPHMHCDALAPSPQYNSGR